MQQIYQTSRRKLPRILNIARTLGVRRKTNYSRCQEETRWIKTTGKTDWRKRLSSTGKWTNYK